MTPCQFKVKINVFETLWSHIGGAEVGHYSFSTPALEEGEYSASPFGCLFQGKLTPSLLRGAGWTPERLWTFGGRKNVLLVSNIGRSNPEPSDQVKTVIEKRLWVYGTCVSSSRGTVPEYRLINIRTWTLMPTDDLHNRGVTDYRRQNTFCEASSFSASQAFLFIFCNSNVYFPINKNTPLVHISARRIQSIFLHPVF